jgi:putative peptidoglycan lipid II flippase
LINIAMVATKVLLVLISTKALHGEAAVEALNVSTSLSYVVGAVAGHLLLARRFGNLSFNPVIITTARVALASVAGGVAAYVIVFGAHHLVGTGRIAAAIALVLGALVGLAAFTVVALQLRIPEIDAAAAALARRRRRST